MILKKQMIWFFVSAIIVGTIAFLMYRPITIKEKKLFKTKKLKRIDISRIVNARGILEAKGTLKIGSLVNGTVEALYAEENQQVKKGDLLARIDDGKGDTNVKYAIGLLDQAKATLEYQKLFYERQKKLFSLNQISKNEFDLAQQGHDASIASVAAQEALYQQNLREFNNKKIISPINGIVIKRNVSLQQGVANFSPPTILYTIAEDIHNMNIGLEISESEIGFVKPGQEARLFFDTYPDKSFKGKIVEVSTSPIARRAIVVYKAIIKIDNEKHLFKPGMTVRARIKVEERKNVIAAHGHIFSLNKNLLEAVTLSKNFEYKPLTPEEKKEFLEKRKEKRGSVKTVWIFKDNVFEERLVEVGITDQSNFEIISGLDETDDVIVDVMEPDPLPKIYRKIFPNVGQE